MARGPADARFEVLARETCYRGFFRLDRLRVRVRLYAGGWSPVIEREVFERGHAACALLYDPGRDQVVLVEQFRAAAVAHPRGPWLIETVAGMIEGAETPEEVVRREAVEEAGVALDRVEPIGELLPSPGGSSERLWMFCAEVDASACDGIHGSDHGEDIRVLVMAADAALAAVAEGRILAANAVVPLQWLALNRDSLRARWGG